jgi:hypothetical protein
MVVSFGCDVGGLRRMLRHDESRRRIRRLERWVPFDQVIDVPAGHGPTDEVTTASRWQSEVTPGAVDTMDVIANIIGLLFALQPLPGAVSGRHRCRDPT